MLAVSRKLKINNGFPCHFVDSSIHSNLLPSRFCTAEDDVIQLPPSFLANESVTHPAARGPCQLHLAHFKHLDKQHILLMFLCGRSLSSLLHFSIFIFSSLICIEYACLFIHFAHCVLCVNKLFAAYYSEGAAFFHFISCICYDCIYVQKLVR